MQFSHSKFLRGNDMTHHMTHHSVCTTIPSPQIIFVSFFLRGGDSCTQAIYKTYEKKGFFGGGGGGLSPDK